MKFLISRTGVYLASLISHLFLLIAGVSGAFGTPLGDITYTYEPWSKTMVENLVLFGLDSDWVYPWVDLLPMLGPRVAADATGFSYFGMWMTGSIVLDLVGLWGFLGWSGVPSRNRVSAGFSWVGLQFLLGPVAISRIDNLSIALVMIALGALLDGKDSIAAGWLAFATWVKVWPAAVLLALVASTKQLRRVLESSQIVLLAILLLGFLMGRMHSLSFFLAQSDRGIQIESVVAGWWLWQRILGSSTAGIYYDQTYLTFQVQGEGVELVSQLVSLAFYVAIAITVWLAWRAWRYGNDANQVFAWVAMTATLDLMVFNKVLSPQYLGWLFVPVVFAIAKGLEGWRVMSLAVASLSLLTFVIYPLQYDGILTSEAMPTALLTIRNLVLVFLLVQANLELTKLGKQVADQRAD